MALLAILYIMFKSLKNALGLNKEKIAEGSSNTSSTSSANAGLGNSQLNEISEWATLQGLTPMAGANSKDVKLDGKIGGKSWRLEQGRPSRDFIQGLELRARAELGLPGDYAVMIMNRALKNELDKRAFSLYTDTLQTQVDPHLPEEMRWLSMYEEVGWESLGDAFLDRYAILADERDRAVAWITPDIALQLMHWPSKDPKVPMVLMMLRGKVYLRMQMREGDLATLEHATRLFTTSCQSALSNFA